MSQSRLRAPVGGLALATAILGGCGSSTTVTTGPPASPSARATAALPSLASDAGASAVAIDQSLLALLPPTVGGLALQYSAEASEPVLSDPHVQAVASSLAYGVAADQSTGDLLVAAVVRLRPSVFTDAFFRDWRDSYDQAACASAGGVTGSAETTIGGRTIFTGRCAGGANTYHVFLASANAILSATSVGSRHLGETLIETLP